MHAVIQLRMQTISMIGSCRELQWNTQRNARLRAMLQITSAQQHSPIHFILPPSKIKSNWRFNALANEAQNTFDSKQKNRPTHYKDTMRPQQAIRSNTEHICTTMFIRRRILRVLPFVTRRWQHPRVLHSPPNAHPHLEAWMKQLCQHVCTQRGRLTPRTGA